MKTNLILKSEIFYLRPLSKIDASPSYLSWLNDPLVNQFLESRFSPPSTLRELEKFINECEAREDVLLMGIFLIDSNRHIGNIKLGPISKFHKTADIGFLIGDKLEWGKNIASQAIILLSNYGLFELGLEKITAGAYSDNLGSKRALIKAGFIQEGLLRSQWSVDNNRQDGVIFGMLKSDRIQKINF